MYTIKMKIYEEPVVEIMVICGFYHHNSDFFLSKKKTTYSGLFWEKTGGLVDKDTKNKVRQIFNSPFSWETKRFS